MTTNSIGILCPNNRLTVEVKNDKLHSWHFVPAQVLARAFPIVTSTKVADVTLLKQSDGSYKLFMRCHANKREEIDLVFQKTFENWTHCENVRIHTTEYFIDFLGPLMMATTDDENKIRQVVKYIIDEYALHCEAVRSLNHELNLGYDLEVVQQLALNAFRRNLCADDGNDNAKNGDV